MGLKQDLQKLARNQCATYDRDGLCLLERGGCRTCLYFRDDVELPRCPYFENSVLPGVDTLHARYWRLFNADGSGKYCAEPSCSNVFEPNSNAQKYCGECRERRQKEQRKRENQRYYLRRKSKGGIRG